MFLLTKPANKTNKLNLILTGDSFYLVLGHQKSFIIKTKFNKYLLGRKFSGDQYGGANTNYESKYDLGDEE